MQKIVVTHEMLCRLLEHRLRKAAGRAVVPPVIVRTHGGPDAEANWNVKPVRFDASFESVVKELRSYYDLEPQPSHEPGSRLALRPTQAL